MVPDANEPDVPLTDPPAVAAPRCPRHAKRPTAAPSPAQPSRRITWREMHEEPFRLFFPLAVLAGLVGVLLWPVMLAGWMSDYPGLRHARLMTNGFFGGFILGFLGTSLPRLLEVKPFKALEAIVPLLLHLACIVAYAFGATLIGDISFATALMALLLALGRRFPQRQDLPPPGFVLMPLAFACALAGLVLQHVSAQRELDPAWELLGRLWAYHGFILLCILGAGGFLLPRFLGVGVREKFATSKTPTPAWRQSCDSAAVTGLLLVGTYPLEAFGWSPLAALLRAGLVLNYLWSVMPFERLAWSWNGVQWLLVTGLVCIPLGILAAGFWPGWRVGLSHIELLGGFGLITMAVATRVVFGHSGQRARLERFHPALTTAAGLMLIGMITRITGDLVPSTMASHYLYGALCWAGGLILWAVCVLPGVLIPDSEA